MQKFLLAIFVMAILALTSCTNSVLDEPTTEQEQQTSLVDLNLQFVTTAETPWNAPTRATRATTSDHPVTRIALRIFQTDGPPVIDQIDQIFGDDNFGTFQGLRLAPGAYKCAIVAHRASAADKPAATITSLTSATIPETNVWDTHTCVYDLTIPSGTYQVQQHTITVPLSVTRLKLTTLDKIPAEVKQVRLTLNSGATTQAAAPISLNPTTGFATTDLSFTRSWDVTESIIGTTQTLNVYGLFTEYPKACDITIEGLDSDGTPLYSRTLTDITFNRAKVRNVSTNVFTAGTDLILNFEEWGEEDETIVIP